MHYVRWIIDLILKFAILSSIRFNVRTVHNQWTDFESLLLKINILHKFGQMCFWQRIITYSGTQFAVISISAFALLTTQTVPLIALLCNWTTLTELLFLMLNIYFYIFLFIFAFGHPSLTNGQYVLLSIEWRSITIQFEA